MGANQRLLESMENHIREMGDKAKPAFHGLLTLIVSCGLRLNGYGSNSTPLPNH
jgi:hypothetical protein